MTLISFLINAHREGAILVPAIRSAIAARNHCRQAHTEVEIVLVGDSIDPSTAHVISQYSAQVDRVSIVSFANLAMARMHGIDLTVGDFICFLDGDDIWQVSWPQAALDFVVERDYRNTIFHTEVFAGFGDNNFLRWQITTKDVIYHPLHLLTTWHFCNNLFAHRTIFEKFPLTPYDHSAGFGSEDWHWSCETTWHGVLRESVPQTVYFYRQQFTGAKAHLGTVRGLALRPTNLFADPAILRSYPSFLGYTAEPPRCEDLEPLYSLRFTQPAPHWLVAEAQLASTFEYDLHTLINRLPELTLSTPALHLTYAYLFSQIGLHVRNEAFSIVTIDCDGASVEERALLIRNLSAIAENNRIIVFCGYGLCGKALMRVSGNILYFNCKVTQPHDTYHKVFLYHFLSAIVVQLQPRVLINVNDGYADDFVEEYITSLRTVCLRSARIFRSNLAHPVYGYNERRVLERIVTGELSYSEIWTQDDGIGAYLTRVLVHRGEQVRVASSGNPNTILRDAAENRYRPEPRRRGLGGTNDHAVRPPEISMILNLHHEGQLIIPTLHSIRRMVSHAVNSGIQVELVMVLDDADTETDAALLSASAVGLIPPRTRRLETNYRNLGLSPMAGVDAAAGKYVAFLDGDDLYSENWLTSASNTIDRQSCEDLILHPAINIYFGREHRLAWHADEITYEIPYGALFFENCWSSLAFTRRQLVQEIPIEALALDEGYAYEDWHWNLKTICQGATHRIAPETCHFIRLKRGVGLNQSSVRKNGIVRPTAFARLFMDGEFKRRGEKLRKGGGALIPAAPVMGPPNA